MKKILTIFHLVLLVAGCKKDEFNYQMFTPDVADIDSIYFSTGATSLIADGRATLQFVVETYRGIQITTAAGTKKDTMVFVDHKTLPGGSLKIYKASGEETGMVFSTTDASPGTTGFYAQVGDLKSPTQTVTLRDQPALPEKLTVNVIFHVFELNPNDPAYDKLTYQPVTAEQLKLALDDVNRVFNNELGNDPNGSSANIEFRLADTNPAGAVLNNAGYNKITYDKSWMTFPYGFTPNDFSAKVNATPAYTWDPQKYLNIYIIPSGANNYIGDNTPKHQIVPAGGEAIPGILNVISDASELPMNQNYEIYGVGVPRTLLFPGTGRRIELSGFLGAYYGLKRTSLSSPTATDYCSDTRKYLSSGQFNNLVKIGIDGIKFLANNAMDDNRYPSLRNSFTLDQVNRIRAVMANCPSRAHY